MEEEEMQLDEVLQDEEKVSWLRGLLAKAMKPKGEEEPEEDEDEEEEEDEDEDDEDEGEEEPIRKNKKSLGTQDCPECGSELAKGVNFCPICGEALAKSMADTLAEDDDLGEFFSPESAILGSDVFQAVVEAQSAYLQQEFGALHKAMMDQAERIEGLEKSLGKSLSKALKGLPAPEAGITEEDRAILKGLGELAEYLGARPRGTVPYVVAKSPRNGDLNPEQVEAALQKGIQKGLVDGYDTFLWEAHHKVRPGLLERIEAE